MKLRLVKLKNVDYWTLSTIDSKYFLGGFSSFTDACGFLNGHPIMLAHGEVGTLRQAMDWLTEAMTSSYIETHKLSRGAPVGRA